MARKTLTGMDWLNSRMTALHMSSLEDVARACGINRGNIHRYFTFQTRPSIDVLPNLCEGLKASPLEVLQALGVQPGSD